MVPTWLHDISDYINIVAVLLSFIVVYLYTPIGVRIKKWKANNISKPDEELHRQIVQINERLIAIESANSELKRATLATLRDRITHVGEEHIKRGYVSINDLNIFISLYTAYKELGGNGFLAELDRLVCNLPLKEELDEFKK